MYELDEVEKWAKATATGDDGLKSEFGGTVRYYQRATKGAVYPYLLARFIPLDDTPGQGKRRLLGNLLLDLVVVNRGGPPSNVAAIMDRCDELFGKAKGSPAGPYRIAGRCQRPIMLEDPGETAELFYTRRGRTYRLWVARVD
jgi:hypothetical protein